jgi:Beta-propeller repeat/PEP-CTERM motif
MFGAEEATKPGIQKTNRSGIASVISLYFILIMYVFLSTKLSFLFGGRKMKKVILVFLLGVFVSTPAVADFEFVYDSSYLSGSLDFGAGATRPESITADASGNIYVAGTVQDVGGSSAFVRKINNMGGTEWTRTSSPGTTYTGEGVAVDGMGNVFVTGTTGIGDAGQANTEGYIHAYNNTGTLIHQNTLALNGYDYYSYDVATNSFGQVYTTGYTSLSGNSRSYVNSYSNTLTDLGNSLILGPNNKSFSITIDNSDNVYIAGQTEGSLDGKMYHGGTDAFVAKYNENYMMGWEWKELLGTTEDDSAWDVAVDDLGSVYITGNTNGDFETGGPGGNDAFAARFEDGVGAEMWKKQWDNPNAFDTSETGWCIEANGSNVIIGGVTSKSSGTTFVEGFLAGYDKWGTLEDSFFQVGTNIFDMVLAGDYLYITGTGAGGMPDTGFVMRFEVVPEPATMMMLGLGGILLRRKY